METANNVTDSVNNNDLTVDHSFKNTEIKDILLWSNYRFKVEIDSWEKTQNLNVINIDNLEWIFISEKSFFDRKKIALKIKLIDDQKEENCIFYWVIIKEIPVTFFNKEYFLLYVKFLHKPVSKIAKQYIEITKYFYKLRDLKEGFKDDIPDKLINWRKRENYKVRKNWFQQVSWLIEILFFPL